MSNSNFVDKFIINLDRRIIYLFVACSLALPLMLGYTLKPARMTTAESFYNEVEAIDPQKGFVLIASDWGPSTQAENKPQTEVAIEHLLRKKIRFALISLLPYADPYLRTMPFDIVKKLEKELTGQKWEYGKDWVNLGFRPNATIMIQGLAKASDLHEVLKTDADNTPIADIKAMNGIHTIKDVSMLMEFTGSVGAFNQWLQFFQAGGYQPAYVHGCTSVTIPDAFNYYVSKQIVGLHEGVAGAAWYEQILSENYPGRKPGSALLQITGISVAHLVIIGFIIFGNLVDIGGVIGRYRRREDEK